MPSPLPFLLFLRQSRPPACAPGLLSESVTFNEIDDAFGNNEKRDQDATRVEAGGYFFTRNFAVKTTVQINKSHGGREIDDNMIMFQVILGFRPRVTNRNAKLRTVTLFTLRLGRSKPHRKSIFRTWDLRPWTRLMAWPLL